MTPDDLRKLIGEMTPGPWINGVENGAVVILGGDFYVASMHICTPPTRDNGSANATGIAALRNVADALVELWAAAEEWKRITDDASASGRKVGNAEDCICAALARLREVKHGDE